MKILMYIVSGILALSLVVGIMYGGWIIQRKINYTISYKSMVEKTVRDMVKEEALKGK